MEPKKKRYWLRGLIMSTLIYLLLVLFVYSTDGPELPGIATVIVATITSPIIPIGLFLGWLYGKIKNRKQITS